MNEKVIQVDSENRAMKVFFSPDYVLAAHSFDTTRKAGWIALSLEQEPISRVTVCEPKPISVEQVLEVHASDYVQAIQSGVPLELAQSQGFVWDPSLWQMVLSSNGGAVAAALAALQDGVAGSLSSGLHHAYANKGLGFCTFNGIALAAIAASKAGAERILILDLDAHCGGGTASLITAFQQVTQLDISVDRYDHYPSTSQSRLSFVKDACSYLDTIKLGLEKMSREARFDLCIYNAGMDPFAGCLSGGLLGITEEVLLKREKTVFQWAASHKLPIAFVVAGGYSGKFLSKEHLVFLHRLTIEQAAAVYHSTVAHE